ncbi:ribonuclease Y [bacterium (Candidatus Gribaldobacteria) CG07_land_8_20_14_0_80_33_18]|uniref:Ribonuclease Y n=1 Tax=bacterium (Candidatus Gribaldobacteria) CG07_land_8_20_14_0_80_33_18 TaxID=2014272 RepID=A0A2M6Z4I4_9BACT|nr:MAG: ribonuclease Y [bacterium (Candidatus Gribaldobacteria) CG10_big_fil_rev_8_21_14_0_10_33_41]PIU47245.1 MAG: ribonuclease Y [bacterium (Candidatus Gribaldobacteria) CG07_land_8_20_14_0_80_33_18]PJA01194.1 MAG: ribonuclease Y [bacterium (Candidatus Gribaldobacteria) CG_4_10_14_0_2_um_filter_33_15]PJB08789.1 MAG: ribonuclease Y [bacterium (Candidatus Gribaldobacteria) CG_4_9_14_3_um_filter_33_9]
MNQFTLILISGVCLGLGVVLGYYARQSIAKKKKGTIEAVLEEKISQAKVGAEKILKDGKEKAAQIFAEAQKETDERRREVLNTEKFLLRREHLLEEKISRFEEEEKGLREKIEKVKQIREELENKGKEFQEKLEKIAGFSKEKAKEELFRIVEEEQRKELLERMQKLTQEGEGKYEKRAKEILVQAIERCAVSQTQETTATTLNLPSEEIKGRIIGKEGRNIKVFEKLTGVEIIVDDTPETVIISSFNPLRRHIAKKALEKLIRDGRIQPARIEETVALAQQEVEKEVKEAGEKAIYETGVLGLHPKLVELLGKLYFRTSYGQNVLLHSIEVALIASVLAEELGLNAEVAKRAGLLHDIGKAIDQQIQGSHVDIGIKILERFKEDEEIIKAMKAHHEEYPAESLEAIIVKVADAISSARPGARKDTLENYLKRLKELEDVALSFKGIENAYAIQAGREIRVFVKPEKIDDLEAYKLAKDIAGRIEEELNYPGEIKVTLIRETRVVEYAK